MSTPTVYADFNNADSSGRLRLNCIGTTEDLSRQGLELREGLRFIVHDEELEAEGEARFSSEEHLWVAIVDWRLVRQKQA